VKHLSSRAFFATLLRMLRVCLIAAALCAGVWSRAAELEFDFSKTPANATPKGFRSAVSGAGKPGEWKVVMDEVATAFKPLSPGAAVVNKRAVLAQTSQDPTDEHFPLLIYEDDTYADFTFTTRFKTVSGQVEQMAGVVFRLQDEKNYYYVRASSKGGTFRFFKLVDGTRSDPIGTEIKIPTGQWHELTVECKGNSIKLLLDGKEAIPALTDNTFTSGKVGFWTKSDSVSYFSDAKLIYIPREYPAQTTLNDILKRYPRIVSMKVFAPLPNKPLQMIASDDPKEVGAAAEKPELDVFEKGVIYQGSTKKNVTVTVPVHDRNGDIIAALRVQMPSFPGQTEQNSIVRAMPYAKMFEERIKTAKELLE
jgi:hypothetical protein